MTKVMIWAQLPSKNPGMASNLSTDCATSCDPVQLNETPGVRPSQKHRRGSKVQFKVPYAPALRLIPFPENSVADWEDFRPTHMAGTMPVSEQPGSDDGPIFCFWIGDRDPESVIDVIAEFIACYDLSGIRFVRAVPNAMTFSLERLPR